MRRRSPIRSVGRLLKTLASGKSFFHILIPGVIFFYKEFVGFISFLTTYFKAKIMFFSNIFEKNKNVVVKSVLIKRGKRNRFFLHVSAMAVLSIGVLISPFISDTNKFGQSNSLLSFAQGLNETQSLAPQDVFQTRASDKPRSEVLVYKVQKGDTLSGIAQKFGISEDTIKWENNLSGDSLTVGDSLKILPVSGIAHKVSSGDTIYTIAKKYDANAQAVVDFPFNDFADPQTFSLVVGQTVIVPDGVKPAAQPSYIARQKFTPSGPVVVSGAGFTWPVGGTMNQYFAWYHPGIDIGASVGTPVVAAQSGVVVGAYTGGWHGGYGTHVIVSGDNGYGSLYAHMSAVNVSVGQKVTAGSTLVGWVGMTGRTTGPHLHFEVHSGGGNLNPLSFLR